MSAISNDDNNNVDTMQVKEKSKSAFMLDRIRQEQGRDDEKVNLSKLLTGLTYKR